MVTIINSKLQSGKSQKILKIAEDVVVLSIVDKLAAVAKCTAPLTLIYIVHIGMSINDNVSVGIIVSCLQLSTLICPLSARWWTTQMKKIFTLKSKILICGKCMEGLVH